MYFDQIHCFSQILHLSQHQFIILKQKSQPVLRIGLSLFSHFSPFRIFSKKRAAPFLGSSTYICVTAPTNFPS